MAQISKNFTLEEFEASEAADNLGLQNKITDARVCDSIRALVECVLQPLRDAFKAPLRVNSGYRCRQVNEAVGGVDTSQHAKGEAADIKAADPRALAQLAKDLRLPYDQMIIYPTFVHFSHKLQGKQRRAILYNYRYTGPKLK